MTAIARLVFGTGAALAVYAGLVRPRMVSWGATAAEQQAAYPGDELVPDSFSASTMATDIAAPPAAIWPWLIQMGNDRAGFYSWDRLDNGGQPSAERVHPEWQDLEQGSRIQCTPDGRFWFDVALLDPERALVLRSSYDLKGHWFNPMRRPPRHFNDGTWGFFLRPTPDGGTRLIVHGVGRGRPRALVTLVGFLLLEPAHWVMQTKQFRELRRRAEGSVPSGEPRREPTLAAQAR